MNKKQWTDHTGKDVLLYCILTPSDLVRLLPVLYFLFFIRHFRSCFFNLPNNYLPKHSPQKSKYEIMSLQWNSLYSIIVISKLLVIPSN